MAYIVHRLFSMAITLFLISIITFTVTNILPGDVAMMIMGTQSNPEALANLRENLGLNDPLVYQYGKWIIGMLTGDWGNSLLFKNAYRTDFTSKNDSKWTNCSFVNDHCLSTCCTTRRLVCCL